MRILYKENISLHSDSKRRIRPRGKAASTVISKNLDCFQHYVETRTYQCITNIRLGFMNDPCWKISEKIQKKTVMVRNMKIREMGKKDICGRDKAQRWTDIMDKKALAFPF